MSIVDPSVIADAVVASGLANVESFVYFVRAGTVGLIKIGHAKDVGARVVGLQTGSQDVLRLVAVVPGGRREERSLHRRFIGLRHHGEWFEPREELLVFIRALPGNAL